MTRNKKYGINLTITVEEVLMIDKENGKILWSDAIAKNMKMSNLHLKFLITMSLSRATTNMSNIILSLM